MKYFLLLFTATMICSATACQEENALNVKEQELTIIEEIEVLEQIQNEVERQQATEAFWKDLKTNEAIPYTKDSLAIFFYYGSAENVSWNGDFNSWSQDRSFENKGTNIEGTDLWYLVSVFPKDARLDYKITLNGSNWILDPENPNQQWSGFGPNSELRMPDYKEDSALIPNDDIEKGSTEIAKIYSPQLNYELSYKVYLPANYSSQENLPTIYVTDGHEYSDEKLGNMTTVLDNLIAQNKIEPILVVFVDPRNPNDPNQNRRQQEYTINQDYLQFFEERLIPEIESTFKTSKTAADRMILGTSLGGLNSSFFGAEGNETFKKLAIQSPAYWYKADQIFPLVQQSNHNETEVFISAGTFNDGLDNATKMEEIYQAKGIQVKMMVVNEGHSWGAWSAQLDDILIYFFGQ